MGILCRVLVRMETDYSVPDKTPFILSGGPSHVGGPFSCVDFFYGRLLLEQKSSTGRHLKKSQINLRFLFGSYFGGAYEIQTHDLYYAIVAL